MMRNEKQSYVFTDRRGGTIIYDAEKGPDDVKWYVSIPKNRENEIIDFDNFVYITNWSSMLNTECYEKQLYKIVNRKLEKLQDYIKKNSLLKCSLYVYFTGMMVNTTEEVCRHISQIQLSYENRFE